MTKILKWKGLNNVTALKAIVNSITGSKRVRIKKKLPLQKDIEYTVNNLTKHSCLH